MQKEIWKEYKNEDLHPKQKFEISNLGRVKSLNKAKPTILKGYINNGFLTFSTRKANGKRTLTYVHKAVAKLFLEKENDLQTKVLHKNYNPLDNRVENLQWATHEESEAHANSSKNPRGSKIKKIREYWDNAPPQKRYHANKLTEVQALKLKKMVQDPNRKTRMRVIAKRFGVRIEHAYRIKNGETWGWLNDETIKMTLDSDIPKVVSTLNDELENSNHKKDSLSTNKTLKNPDKLGDNFLKKLNDAKKK